MRLFFPSYKIEDEGGDEEGSDWDVDVRLESWVGDPGKLFVEADATWDQPQPWNEESLDAVCGRLGAVSRYVTTAIRGFLTYEEHDRDTEE